MKIQTLFLVSIIGFFSNGAFAEAVTGICKDGTEYTGTSKKGACRGHKGIKEWYADKAEASTDKSEEPSKSKKPKEKAEVAKEEAASGPATGLCKDGYETSGTNKRSACRGHDGIKEWYADKEKAAPAEKADAKPKAKSEEPAEATGAVTGLCKDGTEYTGESKRGACRGHKGLKEWYADKDKAAPAEKEKSAAKSEKSTDDKSAKTEEPAAAAETATGLCKDGTEYTGASKRGACRGHKGLKEWYADTEEKESEIATPASKSESAADAKKAAEPPTKIKPAPPAGSGQVWVNTKSKIYHCEGSRFYGATKEGEYMSEADAQAKGYVANRKKECL